MRADSSLRTIPYPAAVYGFLGFRLSTQDGRHHPVLGDPVVRRAMVMALDRAAMVRAVFGPEARVPPGPMSRALWIWDDSIRTLPYDTAGAARRLDSAGWRRSASSAQRHQGGQTLGLDILVPATSGSRRQLAVTAQEMWRRMGIRATVSAVDFPVFQERLARGRFDAFIGAWLDEPSPRSLADQWTAAGIGALNYPRYASPAFDQLFSRALGTGDPAPGRRLWREAMDTLNADAPAAFLYTPTNVAVVARRLEGVEINPFSWLAGLPNWKIRGER